MKIQIGIYTALKHNDWFSLFILSMCVMGKKYFLEIRLLMSCFNVVDMQIVVRWVQ